MADSPFLNLSRIQGIILDWDGVIAETQLNFGPVREKFFGGRRVPLLEGAAALPQDQRQALMQALEAEELRGAALSEAVPGAFRLVELLERRGVRWCVLSRNCRSSIDLAAKTIGFNLPEHTFSRESEFVKPDPRAMRRCAELLDVAPEHCLALGDYLFELLAARRCGMRAVLVQRPGPWGDLADGVYERLDQFVEDFEKGQSLVPWEYHSLVQARGRQWLEKAWTLGVTVDRLNARPLWENLLNWASLGVGRICAAENRELTDEEWRAAPGLSPELLRRPLTAAVEAFLKPRFPLLSIEVGVGEIALDATDPETVLERRLP